MSNIKFPNKDPDEYLDYVLDWSERVNANDSIVNSIWTTPSAGLTIASTSMSSFTTTIWLSAGTLNTTYYMTNRITTVVGRIMDQTCKIKIKTKQE